MMATVEVVASVLTGGLALASLWLLLTRHAARADLAECREVRAKQTAALGVYRADLQRLGEAVAKQPPAREVEAPTGEGWRSPWRSSAAAADAAKWATVVACCRAVCNLCRQRVPYDQDRTGHISKTGYWCRCEAWPIRDAFPKESQAVCGEPPAREVTPIMTATDSVPQGG